MRELPSLSHPNVFFPLTKRSQTDKMATLKRNDILRKHTNRGRPPKPVKERQLKQRAAYQWRDARRIYLAGSFERWRKLKSRLQLKDSSLAWHLLETHDKGCNNCSISSMASDIDGRVQNTDQDHIDSPTKNASEFEPALKKMLRQLCYTYLRFEECVELVGLICVEIDHKSKDNHSIKEVVRRGLAPKERTHERQQSELEANEAEQVTLAMNRLARKDGCIVSVGGHGELMKGDGEVGVSDDAETVLSSNRAVSGSEIIVSASLHPAEGQDPESRTSWDEGGEYSEATTPVCKDSSDTDSRCLAGPSEQGDPAACSISVSQTTEVYSQPLHSYDETDHAALTAGSHQADDSSSSLTCSKDLTHTLPTSWLTQNHGQLALCMSAGSPTHNRDQCMSCLSGEIPNKVVVSGDGTVSHVVHNGPMSRQVYRIDLSNHEQSCEMGVDLDLHGSLVQQPQDQSGEQSRDRAASIESTDSFMEVGIKSQINHAQRLLATPSPTDQSKPSPVPSPVVSLVADSSLRAAFDAFPPHPSETALSGDSLAMDCSPVHFDASSHPNHTSVIKQVNHPEKAASHKADPPACSTEVSFPLGEGGASPPRQSVSEGDLPLDMSLVKEEDDNTEHSVQDVRQGVKEGTTQQDDQSANHDTEDACSTSLSPPSSMHSEAAAAAAAVAAAAARDTAQLLSSTSSMQHLQHYTDRLLQQHQQQRNLDLSLLHASFLSATDTEENARSRKRKLSDLDDSRDGEKGSSPWPRKDMTQKEEYQYLERDPFMDFAEMTRLFPNMQQRTFYRWKRKIKDQFIYVEQRPALTYAEFSQYFPQVREHIFEHWRDLLSQGHRFLGDAGKSSSSFGEGSVLSGSLLKTSGGGGVGGGGGEGGSGVTVKDGEGGGTKSDSYVSQYIFLQKHPNMDLEQFAEVYPEVPRELFCMWKKQIFSDFLKLQTNPKLTYQEFRKQAAVTQDVFSLWKAHLMLMTNPSHLMSTCSNLVSAPTSLTAATPTLPPVSLLAARAGGKSLGADFAAWYASYAPYLGQMALPFWSPLSIISNPSLTSPFPALRDSAGVDREGGDKDPSAKASLLDRLADKELRKAVDSEPSVAVDLPDKGGDAEGSSSPPHPADREGTGEGSVGGHRGRRQSLKPEHYYYLLNPDTPYLSLTRLFPGVSAQRYGRWKRKVTSALSFLEREPDCTDGRFELYFPNVPDEILVSWRERVRQGHSRLMMGSQESGEELSSQPSASTQPPAPPPPVLTSSSPALSGGGGGGHSRDSSVGGGDTVGGEEVLCPRNSDGDRGGEQRQRDMTRHCLSSSSARKQHKANREEYLFVQRYPGVDLATFTSYYPTISVRTFYRWRAEVHKAIAMLRTKPSLGFHEFFSEFPILRERFPDLTEEVFATWQGMVKEQQREEAEGGGSSVSQGSGEEGAENLLVLSNASLLQQQQQPHPTEPSTEERETGSSQQPVADDGQESEALQPEDSGQSHGDASGGRSPLRQEQLLVHMNPYLEYSEMLRTYPSVTHRTFFRWKSEVRHVMEYMRKHPEVAYEDIASAVPGVSFQAFHMWQKLIMAENLQAHLEGKTKHNSRDHSASQVGENRNETDISGQSYQAVCDSVSVDGSSQEKPDFGTRPLAAEAAEESFGMVGSEGDEHHAAKARRQTRDEFIEVMLNPAMDYAEFARRFGTVSQRTFYRWRAHIRDWRALIHADPQLDYATFSRHARDVPEHVFKIWRDWDTQMENSHSQSTNEDLEGAQAESSQSSGGGHSQLAPSTSSQAGVAGGSELGKSGCKQLELIYMAYDYYQSHPTVDFKGLSAVFPSVSMDMFQQWKKAVDVWMEYIRRIPSTNFEDFHRIFPDVKENIFNILKANVLNEKSSAGDSYYLAHSQPAEDMSASCLPTMQTAYSSTSQPVFPQMAEVRVSAKPDDAASDVSGLQGTEGDSAAHPGVYSSAKPASTHSPHLQSSPAVGVQESLSVLTPSVVSIKQEASPNTPLPSFTETVSNLSNLSRLNAMFQNRLPHTTPSVVSTAPPPKPAVLYPPHSPVTASSTACSSTTTSSSVNSTFSTTLAGIVGDSVQKALSSSSSSTTASPAALYPPSQLYSSMSTTTASEPTHPATYPMEEGDAGGSQGTAATTAPQLSVCYEDLAVSREDRGLDMPGHSSQRQRKLQREEYMFVEQNPDVDVQEFLARFPKVSLRTFYRWKREIREEQARGIIGGLG